MGCCKAASSYEMLLIGRTLVGISAGLFTGLAPLYVAEIAPINIRGAMGTVNQLGVTSGILTAMVLGLEEVLGGYDTWPILRLGKSENVGPNFSYQILVEGLGFTDFF